MSQRAAAVGVFLALISSSVLAADAAEVVKARQEHYKEIGKNAKTIVDSLKSGTADAKTVEPAARRIAELGSQIPSWFPEGSGPGHGFKTHAKAEIWTRPEEFRKDAADMAAAADKLHQVSMSGDAQKIGAQMTALGATCKACHTTFREKLD